MFVLGTMFQRLLKVCASRKENSKRLKQALINVIQVFDEKLFLESIKISVASFLQIILRSFILPLLKNLTGRCLAWVFVFFFF